MHDIGTPDVACAVRTSTLHAAIFRAHSARYCMKAQVYECTNFVESDLVQADGNQDLEVGRNRGDKGDPYPGEANNRRFDATSTPSSSDQFGRPSGVAVTNITVSQETVKCKVRV